MGENVRPIGLQVKILCPLKGGYPLGVGGGITSAISKVC